MILLDAFALIAFLTGERAGDQVRALLQDGDTGISAVNLAEVVDVMTRRRGADTAALRRALDPLLDGVTRTVPLEPDQAWRAGELRALHYHRTRRPLSLGDCVLLASARPDDAVATADPHVAAVARDERIGLVTLPGG